MRIKAYGRIFFLLVISAMILAACGGAPAEEGGEVNCRAEATADLRPDQRHPAVLLARREDDLLLLEPRRVRHLQRLVARSDDRGVDPDLCACVGRAGDDSFRTLSRSPSAGP